MAGSAYSLGKSIILTRENGKESPASFLPARLGENKRIPAAKILPRVGALCVLVVVASALFAPQIASRDPLTQDLARRLSPPAFVAASSEFGLGSDALGRDLLSRLLFGARTSLIIAFASVVIATSLGVSAGLIAGFTGGRVDAFLSRLADIQQAIPYLVLAIAVVAMLGSNVANLVLVLGLTSWITFFRVVRAQTLSLREREFVVAARAVGAPTIRILLKHILPNLLSSVVVLATLLAANVIIFEASLGFLGLGVPPPEPSWGGIIAEGRDYLSTAWWIALAPGVMLALLALGLFLMGDEWE